MKSLMTRILRFLVPALLIALLTGCGGGGNSSGTSLLGGGTGTSTSTSTTGTSTSTSYAIAVSASSTSVTAGSTVPITATLTAGGKPVGGQTLTFVLGSNLSGGALAQVSATTDQNGVASVDYTAGSSTGTDRIVVTSASTGSTATAAIGSIAIDVNGISRSTLDQLTLTAGSTHLNGGGVTQLQATVTDATGKVVPDVTVSFAISTAVTGGSLSSGSATTGASGSAAGVAGVVYTAGATAGTDIVTASVTDSSGNVSTASVALTDAGSGYAIVVSAGSSAVSGGSATQISATLTNGGVPVPGQTLSFVLGSNASGAKLAASSAVTDTSGAASVTYTAGTVSGTDTVVVTGTVTVAGVATTVVGSVPIAVSGSSKNTQYQIVLSSSASSLSGGSNTLLQATVTDSSGNPVPNVNVSFALSTSVTGGSLSGSSATTGSGGSAAGVAGVVYTAGATAGTDIVTASVTDPSGNVTTASVALKDSGSGYALVVSAGSSALSGGSATQISATLTNGGVPVPGQTLSFVLGSNASGAKLAASSAFTDTSGAASVTYTAGTVSGTDTVVVRANVTISGVATTVIGSVAINVSGTSNAKQYTITLQSNAASTLKAGDQAQIQATVVDASGNPVLNATVSFSITTSVTGGSLSSPTAVTSTSAGSASVLYNAGATAGQDIVTASVTNQNGIVSSASIPFTDTGSGYALAVTAGSNALTSGASTVVQAQLTNGGKPVVGQALNFVIGSNISGAKLGASSGTTDATGTSSFGYTAGAATGSDTVVVSTTVQVAGVTLQVVGSTTISVTGLSSGSLYSVALSAPPGTNLQTGASTELLATVTDAKGNPVPNVPVAFALSTSVTGGSLSGATATTATGLGSAGVIYTAGAVSGQDVVTASVTDPSGKTASASIALNVTGGNTSTLRITLTPTTGSLSPNGVCNGAQTVNSYQQLQAVVDNVDPTTNATTTPAVGVTVNFTMGSVTSSAIVNYDTCTKLSTSTLVQGGLKNALAQIVQALPATVTGTTGTVYADYVAGGLAGSTDVVLVTVKNLSGVIVGSSSATFTVN